jgi:hypothetical protein
MAAKRKKPTKRKKMTAAERRALAVKLTGGKVRKKRRRRTRSRYRRRGRFFDEPVAQRAWRIWSHDFDTILHELVKNPAFARMTPKKLIARAEAVADAYKAMQDRRRPEGVEDYR